MSTTPPSVGPRLVQGAGLPPSGLLVSTPGLGNPWAAIDAQIYDDFQQMVGPAPATAGQPPAAVAAAAAAKAAAEKKKAAAAAAAAAAQAAADEAAAAEAAAAQAATAAGGGAAAATSSMLLPGRSMPLALAAPPSGGRFGGSTTASAPGQPAAQLLPPGMYAQQVAAAGVGAGLGPGAVTQMSACQAAASQAAGLQMWSRMDAAALVATTSGQQPSADVLAASQAMRQRVEAMQQVSCQLSCNKGNSAPWQKACTGQGGAHMATILVALQTHVHDSRQGRACNKCQGKFMDRTPYHCRMIPCLPAC